MSKQEFFNRCFHCMNPIETGTEICPHCGYRMNSLPKEPFYLAPGTFIKQRYIIGTVEDSGGFSIIYKAWDITLKRVVAVKEYYQSRLMTRLPEQKKVIVFSKCLTEFENDIKNFIQEARIISKFLQHPNIVDVYDYFEENNTAYMIEELLDGISLQEYLKQESNQISCEKTISIALSVLKALEAIHAQNYLHRDISPKNIFLCRNSGHPVIKLIDFGTAHPFSKNKHLQYPRILTPGYAPPEQYDEFGNQGEWTDLYALGATMYRCLTGQIPPDSMSRNQDTDLIFPQKYSFSVPEYIKRIIFKAMSLEISLRFQNVKEFNHALMNQKDVHTLQKSKKRRTFAKWAFVTVGTMAAIVLLTVLGFTIFRQNNTSLIDTEISVWIKIDSLDTEETAKARFTAMTEEFSQEHSNIILKAEFYHADEYDQKLNEAFATGQNIPTLFESSGLKHQYVSDLEDLSSVVQKINENNSFEYYFLDSYAKYFPEQKQIPLSFSIPVVYLYQSQGTENVPEKITSLDDVSSGSYQFYYDQALNYLSGYQSVNITDPLNFAQPDSNIFEKAHFTDNTEELKNGNVKYLFAGTELFGSIETQTRGKLSILAQKTEHLYGYFTDIYSISQKAETPEKEAAGVLLRSLLGEKSENAMNYNNGSSEINYTFHNLPINKKALANNLEIYDMPNINDFLYQFTMIGSEAELVRQECKIMTENYKTE